MKDDDMTNETNDRAKIGGNNPPDALPPRVAAILHPFDLDGTFLEVDNWCDGEPVANEDQLEAVEALLEKIKVGEKSLSEEREKYVGPLHTAWKDEVAVWKKPLDEMALRKKNLAALMTAYKVAKAAAAAEELRKANAEKARLQREAEEKAAAARDGDIQSQREAIQAQEAFQAARVEASATKKATAVKGLHTVYRFEVEDPKSCLNWIAKNDRQAVLDFLQEYASRHHRDRRIAGVKSWTEKVAK